MLWIALHLPLLSLETFAATLPVEAARQPLALMDARCILSANGPARALGVRPGIKRATALALAPQLTLGQADPFRDVEALTAVAHAALAFTPNVSLQPASDAVDAVVPHTVLLEVQSSLRYFGGFESLSTRLRTAIAPLGHRLNIVSAPTPFGAALLARVHPDMHCADLDALRHALDAAPVWLLGPGRIHWDALQGMGLRVIGDLRHLPRSGLARRFGEAVLDEFDRAYGRRPDPREPLVPPPVFESRLELFARADSAEQVIHGAGLLLPRLIAWLAARHAFARRFTLVMAHEPRWRASETPAATPLEIALAEPSRDAAHLLVLLRERLARIELPAPTLELRLHCADIAKQPPPNSELFPTPRSDREGLTRLIERLQARLGREQVQCLLAVEDHRPERATRVEVADAARSAVKRSPKPGAPTPPGLTLASRSGQWLETKHDLSVPTRPVWMVSPVEPLQHRESHPWLDGQPLQLLVGPERIESGWWDGDLAERDYYIAQDREGALVWVYRSRALLSAPVSGWFLHGRFG